MGSVIFVNYTEATIGMHFEISDSEPASKMPAWFLNGLVLNHAPVLVPI